MLLQNMPNALPAFRSKRIYYQFARCHGKGSSVSSLLFDSGRNLMASEESLQDNKSYVPNKKTAHSYKSQDKKRQSFKIRD